MALDDQIPAGWRVAVADAIDTAFFRHLADELVAERAGTDTAIYPPEDLVFNALRLTPLTSVRAVILGQDPYHEAGQAHGLAFSVPVGVKPPPSLVNILAEWQSDLGFEARASGSLEPWARHGVLLLNTTLTVRRGSANSHKRLGWRPFTDAIIRAVAARPDPIVFLLWGRFAQQKRSLIDQRHIVIESNHPSPLSANRRPTPFMGSRPFSRASGQLAVLVGKPIDWSLTGR